MSSFAPHLSEFRRRVLRWVFCLVVAQPAIFVLFVVGTLIFNGGQGARHLEPIYDPLMPFPFLPLPGWVLAVVAISASVLVAVFTLGSQMLDARILIGMFRLAMTSLIVSVYFVFAKTVENDSGFLIAAVFNAVAVVLLVIAGIRSIPEYERQRRAGTLPEGYM